MNQYILNEGIFEFKERFVVSFSSYFTFSRSSTSSHLTVDKEELVPTTFKDESKDSNCRKNLHFLYHILHINAVGKKVKQKP